ncbi:MAG: hypothetical protein ACRD1M_06855 [Terriglobales bacterium]
MTLRRAVRVVAAHWRPGYGAWRGWVPADCAVDGRGRIVAVLRRRWALAATDRATAARRLRECGNDVAAAAAPPVLPSPHA